MWMDVCYLRQDARALPFIPGKARRPYFFCRGNPGGNKLKGWFVCLSIWTHSRE